MRQVSQSRYACEMTMQYKKADEIDQDLCKLPVESWQDSAIHIYSKRVRSTGISINLASNIVQNLRFE
ncbi:hypothetical protein HBH68_030980 [Parastagonospora nodorum]|nr:hypothetical protein HBH68_030980 [Parastagonospora nodorum]KAH6223262.1 hypothetical protein HBI53_065600 [Parastagonospora nodorum]KAH6240888.1 hypothetical protein HBI15_014430 [Parastagonospora nodorum]